MTDLKAYALERMRCSFAKISSEELAYSSELRNLSVLTYARFLEDIEKIPQSELLHKSRYIAGKMPERPYGEPLLDFLLVYYVMKEKDSPIDFFRLRLLNNFKRAITVAAHLLDRPDKQEDDLVRSLFAYRVKRDGSGKLPPILEAKGNSSDIFKEFPALEKYKPFPGFSPKGAEKGIRDLSEKDLQVLSSAASFCVAALSVPNSLTEGIFEELMKRLEEENLGSYADMISEYFLTPNLKEVTRGAFFSEVRPYDPAKGAVSKVLEARYLGLYQEVSILEAEKDRKITELVNENKAKTLDERLSKAAMRYKLRKELSGLKQEISQKKMKLLHGSVSASKGLPSLSMNWIDDVYRDLFYELFIGHEVLKLILEKEMYQKLEEKDLI